MQPTTRLILAATLAECAVERIHDASSIQTAAQAIGYFAQVLVDSTPETHETVFCLPEPGGTTPRTLAEVQERFHQAVGRLFLTVHRAA